VVCLLKIFIVRGTRASFLYCLLKISCHLDLQFVDGRPPGTSCTSGQALYHLIHSLELASERFSGKQLAVGMPIYSPQSLPTWRRHPATYALVTDWLCGEQSCMQSLGGGAAITVNPMAWTFVILTGEESSRLNSMAWLSTEQGKQEAVRCKRCRGHCSTQKHVKVYMNKSRKTQKPKSQFCV